MDTITLLLTPAQFASIRDISIHDVFQMIRSGMIPYFMNDDGIKIPVTWGNK